MSKNRRNKNRTLRRKIAQRKPCVEPTKRMKGSKQHKIIALTGVATTATVLGLSLISGWIGDD